jgi:hypothetical protein
VKREERERETERERERERERQRQTDRERQRERVRRIRQCDFSCFYLSGRAGIVMKRGRFHGPSGVLEPRIIVDVVNVGGVAA